MKKIFYALLLISFSISVNAQTSEFDTADSVYNKGDYEEALKAYLRISRKTSIADEKDLYIKLQIKAAWCYLNLKRGEEGMDICRPLLEIESDEDTKNKVFEIYSLNGLDRVYRMLNADVTDPLQVRLLTDSIIPYSNDSILKTVLKRKQYTYILEGYDYLNRLEHEKAYAVLQQGLHISDDPYQCVLISKWMAEAAEQFGTYDDMLDAYREAGELARINGNDSYYYNALKMQHRISRRFNDMERYVHLGTKLDSLIAKSTDCDIPRDYYVYMGDDYADNGIYDMAESYYRRFYESAILEKDSVSRLSMETDYYSHMRTLKRKEGKYHEAIKYHTLIRKWYEGKYSTDNFLRYTPYFMESILYSDLMDSINFERTCETLLSNIDIFPEAYYRSLVYNVRGQGYKNFGNNEKALFNFQKADSILAPSYSEMSDSRLSLIELKASVLKNMNRFSEACMLYEKYVGYVNKVYGDKSQIYSDALKKYADLKRMQGDMDGSAQLYKSSISIMNDILHRQLRYVPSSDRVSYINDLTTNLWSMVPFACYYQSVDKSFVKLCYNTLLTLKSLVFESDRSMYNTLQAKGTPSDVRDFVSMSVLRTKIEKLSKDYEKNQKEIDSKLKELHELDDKLTLKSQVYKGYTSFLDFKFDDVREQLGKKDVLFDFFDYKTEDGGQKYIAFVIKKNMSYPVIIEMFSQNDVSDITEGQGYEQLYNKQNAERVIQLFWSKLERYATKGANVYYVPSGLMYQVCLESLPVSEKSLLGENYDFIRLTSAREIGNSTKGFRGDKKAVLYGGLNYDMDVSDMAAESQKFDTGSLLSMRGCSGGNSKFEYLAGSLSETDRICEMLRADGYDVTYYCKGEGTEESFLTMHNNSPQILHIATHGFYYTPEEASGNKFLDGSTDAMHLSGLVFSGGNAAWLGKQLPEGVLGGILYASNIACMDLSNVDLAVLSACQSGQGKITREGLFGLQRAFKKSGVQTMILTLWNVSDMITGEFMVEFYRNLLRGSMNKKKAFVKAQSKIRHKYPEPVYWAGFIMVD